MGVLAGRGKTGRALARALESHGAQARALGSADLERLEEALSGLAALHLMAPNLHPAEPDLVRAVPMGDGDLPNVDFLRGLVAGGYDGPVTYEMCSPVRGGGSMENLDRCATRFLEWLDENGFR